MSLLEMIQQLHRRRMIKKWEMYFIDMAWDHTKAGTDEKFLPNNMIETIRQIYFRHFGEQK